MTQEKVDQNRLILELRDRKKLTWQEILDELTKRGLSGLGAPASVKMKYYATKRRQRVSARGPEKQTVTKAPGKQITKAPTQQVYKRATYHLTREHVRDIAILAARREVQKSELMRHIVTEYLSKQRDL